MIYVFMSILTIHIYNDIYTTCVDAYHMLQAGQVGCGDIKKSDAVPSSLTAEQRATIEQNRAKAMDA